jgi:hypothetical protein
MLRVVTFAVVCPVVLAQTIPIFARPCAEVCP